MVQTLLALGAVCLGQGSESRLPGSGLTGAELQFFQQVISRPGGKNGYEEYVEAASFTKREEFARFAAFEAWVASPDRGQYRDSQGKYHLAPDKDGTFEYVVVPAGLRYESTMLEVRQEWIRRFGGLLDIVKRGNNKQVSHPRERIDMDTLFPELGGFKSLAKLFVTKSQVEFGIGSNAAATDALIEGLRFARNFGDGPMIQMLVSVACTSIILSGFEQGLGRLSLQDAQNVAKACGELLSRPALSEAAFAAEFRHASEFAKEAVSQPELVLFSAGDEPDDLISGIRGLDPRLKATLQDRVGQYLAYKQNQTRDLLKRPEQEWHRATDVPLPVSHDDRDPVDGLAAQIVNRISPAYSQSLQAQARSRAQLRILRASARVLAYKWTHGRLPERLEQAAPAAEIEDPASGQKLTYDVPIHGVFRIQSAGFGNLGPIGLVYRRQQPMSSPSGADPNAPRPPSL